MKQGGVISNLNLSNLLKGLEAYSKGFMIHVLGLEQRASGTIAD